MNSQTSTLTRRALLRHLSLAGAACAVGPSLALAADAAQDWQWLEGNWDVWHERLRERLAGSNTWDKFGGKSNCWLTLGGLGTIDDNLLYLPKGRYRALGVRAFDPATSKWAIWWLDGRTAGKLDPPVRGAFSASEGEFQGPDVYQGTPVTVRFRWHDIHGNRPHWDQAFSADSGRNWEINWRNYFSRTSARPTPVPLEDDPKSVSAADWSFLVGHWKVRNRRRRADGGWEEFASTLHNWPVMGGLGNVGDNVFHAASGTYRGMSVRAFDPEARQWRSWWLDGRTPQDISPSVSGGFENGVGTLTGDDEIGGKKVRVRSQWSRLQTSSPRWEQATSADGGSWETNWTADFEHA
jgi:hypothetical protein